jgi:hypothetical protein
MECPVTRTNNINDGQPLGFGVLTETELLPVVAGIGPRTQLFDVFDRNWKDKRVNRLESPRSGWGSKTKRDRPTFHNSKEGGMEGETHLSSPVGTDKRSGRDRGRS